MTFDRKHLVLQWGGTLPGGEEWTCGLRLAGGNTGADPLGFPTHDGIATALTGYVGDAVHDYHVNGSGLISSACRLTYAKLNAVGEDGKYTDGTTIERSYGTTGVAGGSPSALVYPNQIAAVISTTTEIARGYGHAGRYYLPLPSAAVVASTGLVAVEDATALANQAIAFINSLSSGSISGPIGSMNVCVMSRHGTGSTHEVTGVRVGRVLDTQRRRRRSLPETYVSVAR